MSFFDQPFEANPNDIQADFEPIPEGVYSVIIEKAERKQDKNKNNALSLQFKVADGDYAGRKLFAWLNVDHPKKETVAIAARQLNTLLVMCGIPRFTDISELIGGQCKARVTVERRGDTGGLKNEFKFAVIKDGATLGASSQPAKTPNASKPAANNTWG